MLYLLQQQQRDTPTLHVFHLVFSLNAGKMSATSTGVETTMLVLKEEKNKAPKHTGEGGWGLFRCRT